MGLDQRAPLSLCGPCLTLFGEKTVETGAREASLLINDQRLDRRNVILPLLRQLVQGATDASQDIVQIARIWHLDFLSQSLVEDWLARFSLPNENWQYGSRSLLIQLGTVKISRHFRCLGQLLRSSSFVCAYHTLA